MNFVVALYAGGVACMLLAASALAENTSSDVASLWDLSLEQLVNVPVATVASGSRIPVSRAASSVTVISRDQILSSGATNVDDILETVPGLHVTRSDQAFYPRYIFRGISSANNAEALVLINGFPVKTLFTGTRSHIWVGMPVKAIERIEVIRGPGSALYGADAFAGVINIHTRSADDIAQDQLGVRAGSFETWGAWAENTLRLGSARLGIIAQYEDTNGQQRRVEQDAQTLLDSMLGTSASLAPGRVNTGNQNTDFRLDLQSETWQWRLGYQRNDNVETAVGVAQALDPLGLFRGERLGTDITYDWQSLPQHWWLQTQGSFYYQKQESLRDSRLFPPGANLGNGVFPAGMIGNPSYQEDQARLDINGAFEGWQTHIVRFGVGYHWGDIHSVNETKNFDADFSPLPMGVTDVSGTDDAFLQEEQRVSFYGYLQDEWLISDGTALTSGVRFDHFSDFGKTTNPRLALVHEWVPEFSTRLSYGRAFHAPSFVDLYATNNPVRQGNRNLKPETIDSWELAFSHDVQENLRHQMTLFSYRIHDVIDNVGNQTVNAGEREGRGAEWELDWTLLENLLLVANASTQHARLAENGEDVGNAPRQDAYLQLRWQPEGRWNITGEMLWVGEQARALGDTRDPVPDYVTLNLSVIRRNLLPGFNVQFTARNLFDADVREPSPGPSVPFTTAFVPGDFPMAGRSLTGEASWHW